MAIFDKETEFYSRPAARVKSDRSLLSQFVDFIASHVFVATVPISIIAYALTPQLKSANWLIDLMAITFIYGGLIGVPALLAVILASPALLAWKTRKHHGFKRVFDTAFVFLYLVLALLALLGPKPASLPG